MRILTIRDLHGEIPKDIPKNIDLILLTGDLGKSDLMRSFSFRKLEEPNFRPTSRQQKQAYLQAYNSSVSALNRLRRISPVFLVYGNVESTDEETKELIIETGLRLPFLDKKIKSLEDVENISGKVKEVQGIKIAGYSYFVEKDWIERFRAGDKSYYLKHKEEDVKANKFFKILGNVDFLLLHQPPFGILDKVGSKAPKLYRNKHAGSSYILNYIKRASPKYVICGHIHEARGEKTFGKTRVINLGERNYKIIEL